MNKSSICPRFEKAISLLSQRWTALVIYELLAGSQRFSAIQSSIGISGKVLSERLKDLEQQGIIERTVIPDTPVIIEYSLTEKGQSLEPVLNEVENWSRRWIEVESEEA
jgi:DNA-binding HxlR family transcriptional regulator